MLPIGNKPLAEHIIEQLHDAGIQRVHLETHYRSQAFAQHFSKLEGFGVSTRPTS